MFEEKIGKYLSETKDILGRIDVAEIDHFLTALLCVWEHKGFIYTMGNGGSASTASHFVNDFNKGVSERIKKRFRFICLNDNVSTVYAISNDIGYEEIFRFQLVNYLTENDLVIGISGSGNSSNVVKAIEYAKEQGVKTVAFVGYDGGRLAAIADIVLHVPIANMQHVEDVHLLFDHLAMSILKDYLESPNGNFSNTLTS